MFFITRAQGISLAASSKTAAMQPARLATELSILRTPPHGPLSSASVSAFRQFHQTHQLLPCANFHAPANQASFSRRIRRSIRVIEIRFNNTCLDQMQILTCCVEDKAALSPLHFVFFYQTLKYCRRLFWRR